MDAESGARQLTDLADKALSTNSLVDKMDFHQQLMSEWNKLSCDDKKAVGKVLEREREPSLKDDKVYATFELKNGEMTNLSFGKKVRVANDFPFGQKVPIHEQLRLSNPFEGCEKKK
ncbi:MAG: hypothetical protein K2X77_04540 [Candidatus Obscuribacterales bacterium]|jgi:hypothetical protein|nr:hypothetical protein [Candidatus Obscuribacterales bacterium]